MAGLRPAHRNGPEGDLMEKKKRESPQIGPKHLNNARQRQMEASNRCLHPITIILPIYARRALYRDEPRERLFHKVTRGERYLVTTLS